MYYSHISEKLDKKNSVQFTNVYSSDNSKNKRYSEQIISSGKNCLKSCLIKTLDQIDML